LITKPQNKGMKQTKPSVLELRSLSPVLCGQSRGDWTGVARSMKVSDRRALWLGRVTAGVFFASPVAGLALLAFGSDGGSLATRGMTWAVLIVVAFLAWSVAHFAMVWHQEQAPYITPDDVREWESREDTKLGILVPFTYLLGKPEQRRILKYLRQSRSSRPPHARN
jgi:hypothetical protein